MCVKNVHMRTEAGRYKNLPIDKHINKKISTCGGKKGCELQGHGGRKKHIDNPQSQHSKHIYIE